MSFLAEKIDGLLDPHSSPIGRDLKLNLKRVLGDGALDETESALALYATATSVGSKALASIAEESLKRLEIPGDQILEARESAAILAMLNTYYRFRHMVPKDVAQAYQAAGLRMNALSRPALGKERFEMLAFAVSVLNGCETCIGAHEKTLREANVSTDKIHDLARLAATVRAVATLIA